MADLGTLNAPGEPRGDNSGVAVPGLDPELILELPIEIRDLIWHEVFDNKNPNLPPSKAILPAAWAVTHNAQCAECQWGLANHCMFNTAWPEFTLVNKEITLDAERWMYDRLEMIIFCNSRDLTELLKNPWLWPLRWAPQIKFRERTCSESIVKSKAEEFLQNLTAVMNELYPGEANDWSVSFMLEESDPYSRIDPLFVNLWTSTLRKKN